MARINNLTNFLDDVATAIKAKLGDNTPIPASQFDTKIGEIETVGTYQSKTLNIVANGSQTITPDSGYDALSSVVINVQVPVKQLQSKTYNFTENTHIVLSPETGYDGFSSVELTINVPGSTINNQDKTITENGTYAADEGYTGLGEVNVNVPQKMQCFENKQSMNNWLEDNWDKVSTGDKAVVYGELNVYPIAPETVFNSIYLPEEIVLDEAITSDITVSGSNNHWRLSPTEFYGNLRGSGFGFMSASYTYNSEDGITYTRTAAPSIRNMGSNIVFAWDETTKTLSSTSDLSYTTTDYDKIKPFFQTYLPTYDGIYECKQRQNKMVPLVCAPISDIINGTSSNATRAYIGTEDWSTNLDMFGIKTGTTIWRGYECETFDIIYQVSNYPITVLNYGGKIRIGLFDYYTTSSGSGTRQVSYYTIENGTYTKHTVTYDLPSQSIKYVRGNYTYAWCEIFSTSDIANCRYFGVYNSVYYKTTLDNNSTHRSSIVQNRNLYVDMPYFAICETQMNLNNVNQLLPGVTGYGKNQSYTGDGSIYNNLDEFKVNTDIFNLTSIYPGSGIVVNTRPSEYYTNINIKKQLNFVKKSDTADTNYYITKYSYNNDIIQPTKFYTLSTPWYYDKDLNRIFSYQYDSTTRKFICEDGTTHEIIKEWEPVTVKTNSTYVETFIGKIDNIVYSYLYCPGNESNQTQFYVYKYDLSTLTKTTIYSKTLNYDSTYSYSYFTYIVDNTYLLYGFNYLAGNTTSSTQYLYGYIYDGNDNITIIDTSKSSSGVTSCNGTMYYFNYDNYIYILCTMMNYRTMRRYTKSNNSVSTLYTLTSNIYDVGSSYPSNTDNAMVINDCIIAKDGLYSLTSSAINIHQLNIYGTYNGVRSNLGTHWQHLWYKNNKHYMHINNKLYEINTMNLEKSRDTSSGNPYLECTITNVYVLPNTISLYDIYNNYNTTFSVTIDYNSLSIVDGLVQFNFSYLINTGTAIITPIVISTSADYDYSIIYTGSDWLFQQPLKLENNSEEVTNGKNK